MLNIHGVKKLKARSPVFVYFAFWISFGIYFFYWLFSISTEINKYRGKQIVNIRVVAIKLALVFAIYSAVIAILFQNIRTIAWPMNSLLFLLCFGLGIYWFVLIVGALVTIGKEVRHLQRERSLYNLINPTALGILFFVYFIGIIYLQIHINRLTRDGLSPGSAG